jgi:phage-related protein
MANVSWLKILPVIGTIVKDLVAALADGKITIDEIIDTLVDIVTALGLSVTLDATGIQFVKDLLNQIWTAAADKKLTDDETKAIIASISAAFNSKIV